MAKTNNFKGPYNNSTPVEVYLFIVSPVLYFGINYWGFKPMSTVFQIYKGSIRWNLISTPYMGHFWGDVLQLF